jgi:hypothetical protein
VHRLQSSLADLAALARNTIVTALTPRRPLTAHTRPTAVRRRAFDLLDLTMEPLTRQRLEKIQLL